MAAKEKESKRKPYMCPGAHAIIAMSLASRTAARRSANGQQSPLKSCEVKQIRERGNEAQSWWKTMTTVKAREHKPAKDPEYLIAQLEGEHKLALSLHQMMCTMEDDVLNFKTNVMIVSQGLKGAERNIEEALEQFAMAERSLEALELQMINLEQE
ncbi:hypothetical protein L208DRAFT_1381494 [Tricholoma matsutake]|nr:hypothetical protein L208DRAFT_1381494 [Tricholoma matsutake 945]